MATTFKTITIGGKDYPAFADRADANDYLAVSPGATAWRALPDDDASRGPYLIEATRILLRQNWQAGALDDPVPQAIIDASIELAAAMAGGYDAANQASTASGVKRQKAGSVEQEFFAPGLVTPVGNRFPLPVWELIKGYLGGGEGAAGLGGSIASGTCGRSISEIPYDFGYDSERFRREWD